MASAQVPIAQTGEALFLSQLAVIERVISFVSRRHHLSGADADDFGSHVKLKLIEDDYRILRKFEHRSSLPTYLSIVIQRLFLDFRISAWGKWRPSVAARRAGQVAILLEQLTTRDGFGFEEACEILETNHRVKLSRFELERLAGQLPIRMRRRFESDDALAQVPSDQPALDDLIGEQERSLNAARITAALEAAIAALDDQDRLIVTLLFKDGRTVAEIARMLRVDQKGLYRRVDKLKARLRATLEAHGIDAATVLDVLDSPSASLEGQEEPDGTAKRRPSKRTGEPT